MSDPALHVKIDETICQGTGYCARLVPHVFALDDNSGVVINPHPPAAQQELLEEAATLCPTRAITY